MLLKCRSCGYISHANAEFCIECGRKLKVSPLVKLAGAGIALVAILFVAMIADAVLNPPDPRSEYEKDLNYICAKLRQKRVADLTTDDLIRLRACDASGR